jgi:NADH-quinone oxidoreductase subunit M
MLQRVLFGEITKDENTKLTDLDWREKAGLLPLVAMAIIMGVAPMLFLRASQPTVNALSNAVKMPIIRAAK